MAKEIQDPLAGGREIKPSTVSFNKVGDWVKGTYTGFKTIDGTNGQVSLYEIKGESGQYHTAETGVDENGNKFVKVQEPGADIVAGDYYSVWGGKDVIDSGFKKTKIGQVVGIKFDKTVPAKKAGNSPFKVFRFVQFDMDQNYMGETSNDISAVADTLGVDGIVY